MLLRTVVRDCLYVNWALNADSLPPLPAPLRPELHAWNGGEVVFASALLFRQDGLHLPAVPLVRLSYPQFHLRLYVLDEEGVPAVYFQSLLMPRWVVPSARMLAEQPARAGRFDYPRLTGAGADEAWRWSVRRRCELRVKAEPTSPTVGHGPSLGSWERLTSLLGRRRRGYYVAPGGLRRVEATLTPQGVWPLRAEVEEAALLSSCLPLGGEPWPATHSAWLCPEMAAVFELGAAPRELGAARAPVAADPATFGCSRRDLRSAA